MPHRFRKPGCLPLPEIRGSAQPVARRDFSYRAVPMLVGTAFSRTRYAGLIHPSLPAGNYALLFDLVSIALAKPTRPRGTVIAERRSLAAATSAPCRSRD